jgi:hypothetical protein
MNINNLHKFPLVIIWSIAGILIFGYTIISDLIMGTLYLYDFQTILLIFIPFMIFLLYTISYFKYYFRKDE